MILVLTRIEQVIVYVGETRGKNQGWPQAFWPTHLNDIISYKSRKWNKIFVVIAVGEFVLFF